MFFKNKENKENQNYLIKICALLIHAAKIDENFSEIEEEIIKKTLLKLGSNQINIDKTIKEGKALEENSNQILDFTKEVKNLDEIKDFIKICENIFENTKIILEKKWASFKELFNEKNKSRKECLLLPLKTVKKALND